MARETLQSLRMQLATVQRALDTALDYQRKLERRLNVAEDVRAGCADVGAVDLMDIAEYVIPPSALDMIDRPTKAQIIHAAKEAEARSNAIGTAAEDAAGRLGLECQHDDVVAVIDEMREKINDQFQEIEDLKNSRPEPSEVKDLLADLGLDTYPFTQYPIGDPMLAIALKAI